MRVLVFTAHDDDRYVFPLLDAGANGYVLKTTGQRDWSKAIRDVTQGRQRSIPRSPQGGGAPDPQGRFKGEGMVEALTEREMEVLRPSPRAGATRRYRRRSISARTPSRYTSSNVFGKLGVKTRTEACALCHPPGLGRGVVEIPP